MVLWPWPFGSVWLLSELFAELFDMVSLYIFCLKVQMVALYFLSENSNGPSISFVRKFKWSLYILLSESSNGHSIFVVRNFKWSLYILLSESLNGHSIFCCQKVQMVLLYCVWKFKCSLYIFVWKLKVVFKIKVERRHCNVLQEINGFGFLKSKIMFGV